MNGNGRGLELPGRVNIQVNQHNTPMATPSCVVFPSPQGPSVQIFGGMTKLETVAAQIAGQLVPAFDLGWLTGDEKAVGMGVLAVMAADAAEAVLAECAKRQQPAEQE